MTGNGPLHTDLQISPDISRPKWVSREPPGANLQGSPRQGDALEVKLWPMDMSPPSIWQKGVIWLCPNMRYTTNWLYSKSYVHGEGDLLVDEIWCSGCMPRIFRQSQFISGWWFGSFGLFSISYMGCHRSHWRTHIFQDGYCTTNQIYYLVAWFVIFPYIGNNTPIWLSYFSEGNHQPVVGWCWLHNKYPLISPSYIPCKI